MHYQFVSLLYTFFQNGRHLDILSFLFKLDPDASFKAKYSFEFFKLKSEASRANLRKNKKIFKWRPFRKKVYLSSILTGGRHVQMYFIPLLSLSSKSPCIYGNYCSMGDPYLHNLLPSWSNWVHFIQFIPLRVWF